MCAHLEHGGDLIPPIREMSRASANSSPTPALHVRLLKGAKLSFAGIKRAEVCHIIAMAAALRINFNVAPMVPCAPLPSAVSCSPPPRPQRRRTRTGDCLSNVSGGLTLSRTLQVLKPSAKCLLVRGWRTAQILPHHQRESKARKRPAHLDRWTSSLVVHINHTKHTI